MNKEQQIEILLDKRFGRNKPKEISELIEINTFIPADNEQSSMGIGIQLIIDNSDGNFVKEDYQINSDGIIFSWGKTPVIDTRSLENKISNCNEI